MKVVTKTIKVKEYVCESCGNTENSAKNFVKCRKCNEIVCPQCMGYYRFEVLIFKGYTGFHTPIVDQSKTWTDREELDLPLCMTCGKVIEAELAKLGLRRINKFGEDNK